MEPLKPNSHRNQPSLNRRLEGMFIKTMAFAIGLAWVAAVGYLLLNQRDTALDALRTDASMLSAHTAAALRFGGRTAAEEALGSLGQNPAVRWAVITKDDAVLASYGPAPTGAPLWNGRIGPGSDHYFGFSLLGLRQRVTLDAQTQGWLFVEADLSASNLRFLAMVVMTFSFALIIVALALRLFQERLRSIATPIVALSDLVRNIAGSGDLSLRAKLSGYREIARLGEDFNGMLMELEQRDGLLQQELESRRRTESHVEQLAAYDPVTHLPNRHYFRNRLDLAVDRASRQSEQMALILIDVDNFGHVNVDLGPYDADKLLEEAAKRLTAILQSGDVLCRIGGDEFGIIMENLDIRARRDNWRARSSARCKPRSCSKASKP
jgi:GGDEF domain-containing protein